MIESGDALLRVRREDRDYQEQAKAEASFWQCTHPCGLEAMESQYREGTVDAYMNARFTGDPRVHWYETIARRGPFRRGLVLGTSSLKAERSILETNPELHLTFVDISEGALARRQEELGRRFPGRVSVRLSDLNFIDLEPDSYDLIVSNTIHHVQNLEFLSWQVSVALTSTGYFFIEDYVGEPRFQFDPGKKRLFEHVYEREIARQPGRSARVEWLDASDLSPFCGVRADEILSAARTHLVEVDVRTAGALTIPLMRIRPADGVDRRPVRGWRAGLAKVRARLGLKAPPIDAQLNARFLEELFLVGDAASDAGLVKPGIAFAIYQKPRA